MILAEPDSLVGIVGPVDAVVPLGEWFHRECRRNDAFYERFVQLMVDLHPAFWRASEWLIGRDLKADVVCLTNVAGRHVFDAMAGTVCGWPVSWVDGDGIRIVVDPSRMGF